MKKSLLFSFMLGNLGFFLAQQSNLKLQAEFQKQKLDNERRFDQYLRRYSEKDRKANLAGFTNNNIPVFWSDSDARANRSANITSLQDGSLQGLNGLPVDGEGIEIMVMDGGRIFEQHVEFGGATANPVRVFDKENGQTSYSSHSTSVAGVIGALGLRNAPNFGGTAASKGVLTHVKLNGYSRETTSLGTNFQKLEAATGANVSNHSYGVNLGWAQMANPVPGWYWIGNYELNSLDTYSGSYGTNDANFDKIVYSNPNHIIVKSAGNYYGNGPDSSSSVPAFKFDNASQTYIPFAPTDIIPALNCSQGYNCIGWGSLAKNIIVVGATNQLATLNNSYTSASDVQKASFSSAGPRKDGAIKPDISAVGSSLFAPRYNTTTPTSINSYLPVSGTSVAAPIISGIAGAVTQINRRLINNPQFVYKADEMKALLTHTANEAGNIGPDVWFGWGFADARQAAELVIDKVNNNVTFERNALISGTVFSKEVIAKGNEALKATISWIDPAATPFTSDQDLQNNHASRLVNDLDLRIIDTQTNNIIYPWKLDINNPMVNATKGDNTVDNVEQVLVDNPVIGRKYRIEVSNKGSLVNDNGVSASQDYAIIITGYNNGNLSVNDKVNLPNRYVISPNPTKGEFYITNTSNSKKGLSKFKIEVYDLAGKLLLQQEGKEKISVSHLPNGLYLVKIVTPEGKIQTEKLIIEK